MQLPSLAKLKFQFWSPQCSVILVVRPRSGQLTVALIYWPKLKSQGQV